MQKKKNKTEEETAEDKKFPLPVYDSKDDIYEKEKEEPFDENHPEKIDTNSNNGAALDKRK